MLNQQSHVPDRWHAAHGPAHEAMGATALLFSRAADEPENFHFIRPYRAAQPGGDLDV